MYMNSQFVMISIVWIQMKINSLMAKVISISKSLASFSMPDIMLSALHGLTDSFTPQYAQGKLLLSPSYRWEKLRQRANKEYAQ